MAAVLDTKTDPAAKFDTKVDEQLAEATSRIRFHDITFGALLASGMLLAYFTAMIVLDKYLVLPEWVRQVTLGGFLVTLGAAVWYTILRPLRREINPLYAAVQVERTVDDAKNSVVGYVDAKGNEKVHPTVRAAMGARAAKSAAEADLNQAVDHRSLLYAGAGVVTLALLLVVLFFVFRPTQFRSLAGRALMPFTSSAIATRTQLSLVKPDPADSTITSGQSVTVAVFVAGKVPAAESPERVRVLLRHNPADPNYEVVPMERGESNRDWAVRVPDYLVQNGFWYKVAAGDAETSEHKITVRTAPLFTDFEANYEYPAYLRMKPLTGVKGNRLVAYRGSKVTLFAKTNREVKDGRMDVDPTAEKMAGRPAANRPDTLQFEYKLAENGSYRLHFTATNGERNADPPPFAIQLLSDLAPTITVLKPEEDEIPLPANGQLAVDATIGDDFGIDKAWLKLRLAGETEKLLVNKPYQDGKSFLRAIDNTWPTTLDYKDSLDLGKLKDAAGLGVELKEGMVLEYWLEAADNCTEPKANVGKSAVKHVRLTAPVKEPEPVQKQNDQKQQRKNEEQKHNDNQQKKLDNEDRPPPQQDPNQPKQDKQDNAPPKQDGKQDPDQKKDGTGDGKKDNTPQAGGKEGDPKKDNTPPEQKKDGGSDAGMGTPDKKDDAGMPPQKDGTKDPMNPPEKGGMDQKGSNDPMKGDNTPKGPNDPMNGGAGNNGMNEAPMPRDPGSNKIDEQAEKVQQKINEDKKNEGNAKPNPGANANDRTDPAQPKPQPMNGPKPEDGTQKEPPKPTDPANPMGGGNAAESKPEGNVKPPPAASEPKPNDPANPMGGDKGTAGEKKPEPIGAPPGQDKPDPKAGDPMNPPKPNEDPKGGGEGKPAAKPEAGEQPKEPKPDPAGGAGQPKPMNEPNRGGDNAPQPKAGEQPAKPPEAGEGKPQNTPKAGEGKPAPKDQPNPMGDAAPKPPPQGMGDPMMPQPGDPATAKPDNTPKPMPGMPEQKGVEKGTDQGDPQANNGGQKQPGDPKGGEKKPDPKEFADAAKDLNSPDPDKKKAAQDKIDKQFGKENREAAEKLAKDLQSPDKATREAAEKKFDDMKKQAEKNNETAKKDGKGGEKQPGGGGEKPDPKAVEQAVKDLNSPDKATRDAAKEKLEKQLGDKGREKAEDIAKDLQSGDFDKRAEGNQKLQDLKKEAEEKAKGEAAGNKIDPTKKRPDGPPGNPPQNERTILDDAKKRLESSQLQLDEFKKNEFNKDLHDKLGMSPDEYKEFLDGYEKRVKALEKEVVQAEKDVEKLPPLGTPTQNVSGGGKVEGSKGGGTANVGGTTFAPPGFGDAAKKFREDALKYNSTPKK